MKNFLSLIILLFAFNMAHAQKWVVECHACEEETVKTCSTCSEPVYVKRIKDGVTIGGYFMKYPFKYPQTAANLKTQTIRIVDANNDDKTFYYSRMRKSTYPTFESFWQAITSCVDKCSSGGGTGNTSVLTNNLDGTYTHNDGAGTVVTFNTNDADSDITNERGSWTDNGDGTYTYDDGAGNTTNIDTNDDICQGQDSVWTVDIVVDGNDAVQFWQKDKDCNDVIIDTLTQTEPKTCITQNAHGFAAGDVIAVDTTAGTWRDADSLHIASAVVTEVTDANNFCIGLDGIYEITGHGLTIGRPYYTNMVGGQPSLTKGTNYEQFVLSVLDANTVRVRIGDAFVPNEEEEIVFPRELYDTLTVANLSWAVGDLVGFDLAKATAVGDNYPIGMVSEVISPTEIVVTRDGEVYYTHGFTGQVYMDNVGAKTDAVANGTDSLLNPIVARVVDANKLRVIIPDTYLKSTDIANNVPETTTELVSQTITGSGATITLGNTPVNGNNVLVFVNGLMYSPLQTGVSVAGNVITWDNAGTGVIVTSASLIIVQYQK